MEERLPRKLAAILYADVAGYSRLTGADEDTTHRILRKYLDLISSTIESHGGTVMHYAGDAVLAQFAAVVDAVAGAVAIQNELKIRNEDLPNDQKLEFRVGVNLGDVIEDRGDIYGDGVNVAARLESLAEPGGICISDAVRTAIGRKLGFQYDDMGVQTVKNIAEPVRSFHVRFRPGQKRDGADDTDTSTPISVSEANVPALAVLPFRFIGNPGDHEYLAIALTESVGSALTHFREYKIVADDDIDTATYALSGTLQLAGSRVRISLQLSATDDRRKIWSQKFDRELSDIFELQDEISAIIAAYLGEVIWQETARALATKSQSDFTAMDWCYYAVEHVHRLTRDDLLAAKRAVNKAMILSPELVFAKFALAFVLTLELGWGWTTDRDKCRTTALALTEEVLRKDPSNANSHRLAARLYGYVNRQAQALIHSERAVSLNPYDGDMMITHAQTLAQAGRPNEAIPWVEKALRYNPQPPAYYRQVLMSVQFWAGDYTSALESFRRIEGVLLPPSFCIAVALLQITGCCEEAAAKIEALLKAQPDSSIESARSLLAGYEEHMQLNVVLEALRMAGLPDENRK